MAKHNKLCVGIDVPKEKLDVACSNNPRVQTFASTKAGLKQLAVFLKKHRPEPVCLEATGTNERTLIDTLNLRHAELHLSFWHPG